MPSFTIIRSLTRIFCNDSRNQLLKIDVKQGLSSSGTAASADSATFTYRVDSTKFPLNDAEKHSYWNTNVSGNPVGGAWWVCGA